MLDISDEFELSWAKLSLAKLAVFTKWAEYELKFLCIAPNTMKNVNRCIEKPNTSYHNWFGLKSLFYQITDVFPI